jgi:hypothetical protein
MRLTVAIHREAGKQKAPRPKPERPSRNFLTLACLDEDGD